MKRWPPGRWNAVKRTGIDAESLYGLDLDAYLEGDASVQFEDVRSGHPDAGLEMLRRLPVAAPRSGGRPNRVTPLERSNEGIERVRVK